MNDRTIANLIRRNPPLHRLAINAWIDEHDIETVWIGHNRLVTDEGMRVLQPIMDRVIRLRSQRPRRATPVKPVPRPKPGRPARRRASA